MPQFICTGTVELRGVDFYIEADNLEEAKAKAKSGDYIEYDTDGAETYNCTLDAKSVEPNE
jgi:hypothetical protein